MNRASSAGRRVVDGGPAPKGTGSPGSCAPRVTLDLRDIGIRMEARPKFGRGGAMDPRRGRGRMSKPPGRHADRVGPIGIGSMERATEPPRRHGHRALGIRDRWLQDQDARPDEEDPGVESGFHRSSSRGAGAIGGYTVKDHNLPPSDFSTSISGGPSAIRMLHQLNHRPPGRRWVQPSAASPTDGAGDRKAGSMVAPAHRLAHIAGRSSRGSVPRKI
jgi:hypothetical protein